jgi:hypothetical protein
MPPHLETVLELELAICDVLAQTAKIPRDGWPTPPTGALETLRPDRGPAQRTLTQPVDIRRFMRIDKPDRVEPDPGPVTWLIYLADLQSSPKTKILGNGPVLVLELCDGARTTAEIATTMESEYGVPAEQITKLVGTWLAEGVLVA